MRHIDFRVLGPIEAYEEGRRVALGGAKQRALLATLLLHNGESVSTDRLIDLLWGECPPPSALNSVRIYVSGLRKTLGAGRLVTRDGGYAAEIDGDELDLHRFELLVREGRELLAEGDPEAAADRLYSALRLWRGPALHELAGTDDGRAEVDRLQELHLAALEQRIEADLELARASDLVPELEALVRLHPLRERLRGQLMLALYRTGRQAEALDVYRQGHRLLVDELGLDSDPALQSLEQAILNHDPTLNPSPRPPPTPARRRGPLLVAVAATLLVAAAAAIAFRLAEGRPAGLALVAPSSVGVVDPATNRIVAQVPIAGTPERLATGAGGSVWVGSDDSGTVSSLNPRTYANSSVVATAGFPSDLAVGEGAVWVVDGKRGELIKVDPAYNTAVASVRISAHNPAYDVSRESFDPISVAAGAGSVWVTNGSRWLVRVDPKTARVIGRIDLHQPLDGVALGEGWVWAISGPSATLFRLDPRTRHVTRIAIVSSPGFESPYPLGVAVGQGWVWVLNGNTGTVTKVDPVQRAVFSTIRIGVEHGPTRLALGAGAAWVANSDGSLSRIDPASNTVHSVAVAHALRDVAVEAGRVWVTTGSGLGAIASPSLPARNVHALPPSSCSPIYFHGGQPQYLISADLPLQGFERAAAAQAGEAIQFVLREHLFRAGRYTVGYQACDDSTAGSTGTVTLAKCAANAHSYANDRSVIGVIGPLWSGCSEVEVPILDRAPGGPLAMIAAQNTYVGLTHSGPGAARQEPGRYYPTGIRNYVRIIAADDVQAAADALLAKRLRARKVLVVRDEVGNGYGVGFADAFALAARKLGLTIVGVRTWNYAHPRPGLIAAEAHRRRASAVFIAAGAVDDPRIGILIRSLHDRAIRIIAPDAFSEFGKLIRFAGPAAEGMTVSVPGLPSEQLPPAGKAFVAAFARAVGQTPTQFSVYSAQATAIMLDAIARSNGTRSSVRANLFTTKISQGILGTFSINPNGDSTAGAVTIYRIVGGTAKVARIITPGSSLIASSRSQTSP